MSFPTPAPIEPSSESSSPEQPRGLRIVVAEDEALIRMDLVEMLAEAGYDVVGEAGDGEEAIAMVRELRPDLVLLDVKMPVLDGIEATRRIIAAGLTSRVLMLTTYDLDEHLYDAVVAGKSCVVEYEPDADLRDTEQVPLLEEGGIEAFIRREVLPYTPDAWVNNDATKIGYEVSITRHFYKPQALRTLEEISADILAIEKEAEGLLDGLLKGAARP